MGKIDPAPSMFGLMKRSSFVFVFVLSLLFGCFLAMSTLPSSAQTANTSKPVKTPTASPAPQQYGSVRTMQNEPQRVNPLRSEMKLTQSNPVLQVSGTGSPTNPTNAAILTAPRANVSSNTTGNNTTTQQKAPQKPKSKPESKKVEPVNEFDGLGGLEDLPPISHDDNIPHPEMAEETPEDQDLGFSFELPEMLEQMDMDQFADSASPSQSGQARMDAPNATDMFNLDTQEKLPAQRSSRSAARDNSVTPQNAQPMAQVDPSATVQVPMMDSNLLTPPSPAVRNGATRNGTSPQVTMQNPPQNNARATNQGRQASPQRNAMMQEPAEEGTGVPGSSNLEGKQSPQLVLEKLSPPEAQINQPAVLKTVIRNIGQTTAKEIVLKDQVPRVTRLVSTDPKYTAADESDLYWSLGSLAPGEEVAVEMTVVPLAEGEFGSVATLQFTSEASGKTVATRAMLDLEISANPEVLLGEKVTYNLTLTNPGTGTATGVVMELYVPDGLVHEKGRGIEFPVGEIKPGETKPYPLTLLTQAAGNIMLEVRAQADNNLEATAQAQIEVLAPDLQLGITGPRQRVLNHKVTYVLTVANPGTASAHGVDLVAKLPKGMKFESTDQQGIYSGDQDHLVRWRLEELPAKESGEIELVLLPLKEGEQKIRFEGVGQSNLQANVALDVNVQGMASLSFGVACVSNPPVEVGKTAVFDVKVINRGTKSANNVSFKILLSEGMQFVSAEGPTKYRTDSGAIQFDPLAILEPKQEKTFRFTAKCLKVGDHRISVEMSSNEQQRPVTKEESVLVYGDQ